MLPTMRNVLIAFLLTAAVYAQPVNPALLERPWPAWWIAHPAASPTDFGVFHFRKAFPLAAKPERFVVHVSADNRYRLFANGQSVSTGPAQSGLLHWRFETVDLAPYLRAGNNVLAAVVWNGGLVGRPMAQISHRTGFVLQSDDPANKAVNTNSTWKVIEDTAYQQIVYKDNDPRFQWNYYVAGATERVDAAKYPWGWEQPAFDDSTWLPASQIDLGAPAGIESHQRWQLKPRSVPFLTEDPQRFERVARAEGAEVAPSFVKGSAPIRIRANSQATILLDQGTLTTGYPVLWVSGGRGAQVHVTYSESLYDSKGGKGDRNQVVGKHVMGPARCGRAIGAGCNSTFGHSRILSSSTISRASAACIRQPARPFLRATPKSCNRSGTQPGAHLRSTLRRLSLATCPGNACNTSPIPRCRR